MAKTRYRQVDLKPETLERARTMISVVDRYQRQGLTLTARQLYYQLVAHHGLPNTEQSYKATTALLTKIRYVGMVDWDAVEDRGRVADVPLEFRNLAHRVEAACENYRLDRWRGQTTYAELWVEKQALAGVLEPLASEFHAVLMVNKGYSSASAMHDAAQRICARAPHRDAVIFYLGDHDPSGMDMVRDIGDRLREFRAGVEVRKLALTMEQIEEHDPPPNPAKTTDSRYARYAAEHGDESWEVDALPPEVLQQIIREAFEGVIDEDALQEVLDEEEEGKERLRSALEGID